MKKTEDADIAYKKFMKTINKDNKILSKAEKEKKRKETQQITKIMKRITFDTLPRNTGWDTEKNSQMKIESYSNHIDALMNSYRFDKTNTTTYTYNPINTTISIDEYKMIGKNLSQKKKNAELFYSKKNIHVKDFASPYQSLEVLKQNNLVVSHINNLNSLRHKHFEESLNNEILKLLEYQKNSKGVKVTQTLPKLNFLENNSGTEKKLSFDGSSILFT